MAELLTAPVLEILERFGIAGALLAVTITIFWFYRIDRKECAKRHEGFAREAREHSKASLDVMLHNIEINTRLAASLDSLKDSIENRRRRYE